MSAHLSAKFVLTLTLGGLLALPCGALFAQEGKAEEDATAAKVQVDQEAMVQRALKGLLEMQEGEKKAEWPYEGVYSWGNDRKRGKIIPIGYRVGGTAIAGLALLEAPGLKADKERHKAIDRATEFILDSLKTKLMLVGLNERRYDVRGWGHTYALLYLLRLQDLKREPSMKKTAVRNAVKWLVKAIQEMAIPKSGGWNYSMRAGFQDPRNSASPFMTGPTLQALFHAKARGHAVKDEIVTEALDALDRGRTDSGGYAYSVSPRKRRTVKGKDEESLGMMDKKPGSTGRMCVTEATLFRAGRGDVERVRDAVKSFFEHWDALKVRKQKNGTHIQPYGVAPYYFIYAHYYCAQAIECLPEDERPQWRQRMAETLAREEEQHGGWNDRVFPRSRNYGAAMGLMALIMSDIPEPLTWESAEMIKKREEAKKMKKTEAAKQPQKSGN